MKRITITATVLVDETTDAYREYGDNALPEYENAIHLAVQEPSDCEGEGMWLSIEVESFDFAVADA